MKKILMGLLLAGLVVGACEGEKKVLLVGNGPISEDQFDLFSLLIESLAGVKDVELTNKSLSNETRWAGKVTQDDYNDKDLIILFVAPSTPRISEAPEIIFKAVPEAVLTNPNVFKVVLVYGNSALTKFVPKPIGDWQNCFYFGDVKLRGKSTPLAYDYADVLLAKKRQEKADFSYDSDSAGSIGFNNRIIDKIKEILGVSPLQEKLETLKASLTQLKTKLGTLSAKLGALAGVGSFSSVDLSLTSPETSDWRSEIDIVDVLNYKYNTQNYTAYFNVDSVCLDKFKFNSKFAYRIQNLDKIEKCEIKNPIGLTGINFVNNAKLEEILIENADESFGKMGGKLLALPGLRFESCPNLKRIIIRNCPGLGRYELKDNNTIETIHINNCHSLNTCGVVEIKNLNKIDLTGCEKLRYSEFVGNPVLTEITFDKALNGTFTVEALKKMNNPALLKIEYKEFAESGLPIGFPTLESLNFGAAQIVNNDNVLKNYIKREQAHLYTIEDESRQSVPFSNNPVYLYGLTNIKAIVLENNDSFDVIDARQSGVEYVVIKNCKNLKTVYLTQLDSLQYVYIEGAENLVDLVFEIQPTIPFVKSLKNLILRNNPKLKELNLRKAFEPNLKPVIEKCGDLTTDKIGWL